MIKLPRDGSLALWNTWWQEMKEEWFKVEVLQDYSGEDQGPSLEAWLAGDEQWAIELMIAEYSRSEWVKMCQASPARKRRFHIVEEPYSPYLRWEIELYRRINIPLAGEEVYLVPVKAVRHLVIPNGDIAIFDGVRVAQNHYTRDGRLESISFYEKEIDDINQFLHLRKALPEYAVALASQLKTTPE